MLDSARRRRWLQTWSLSARQVKRTMIGLGRSLCFFFQAYEHRTMACCLHGDLRFEGYSSIHPSRYDGNFRPLFR